MKTPAPVFFQKSSRKTIFEMQYSPHTLPSPPPATFNQNQSRIPIDAIWVSPNLDINRAGFMPFDGGPPSAPSDGHRMLWIEVGNYSFLGKHISTTTPPLAASRVKSNDPQSVRRYHRLLRKQYKSEKVFKTYKKLKEEQELILANKTVEIQ
jgi:hypothetical protein